MGRSACVGSSTRVSDCDGSSWSLQRGVVVLGVVQVNHTSVDTLPEFQPPTVEVQTEALGLSAAEVEQLITVPLEQDLLVGVPFLDEIESVSLPGLSSVVMTFEPGTKVLEARQVVQERLTQAVGVAGLPAVAKTPQMIQPLSSSSRVAMLKLDVGGAHADRDVGPGALGDQPSAHGGAGRGQRLHLGQPGAAAPGPGRPRPARAERRHPEPDHPHGRQRPRGVAPVLPRSVEARHRRLHRHAQPAAERLPRTGHLHP